MKVFLAAFTHRGASLGLNLRKSLESQGIECDAFAVSGKGAPPLMPMPGSLGNFAAQAFREGDALIFVGACGIAVRAIAPYVKDKTRDPAVVVLDEGGRFAISLLSGHIGGANRLAELIAELIGAVPVITTATDGRGIFGVDSWAESHGLSIMNPQVIRNVSGDLLEGLPVGIAGEFPLVGELPSGFIGKSQWGERPPNTGVLIALNGSQAPFANTLWLVPSIVSLGIGCRKGISPEQIEAQVQAALEAAGTKETPLPFAGIEQVCSVELKREEPGLLKFCEKYRFPLRFFDAGILERVPGSISSSPFVKGITGVDNVCERAALAGCGPEGCLLLPKIAGNGVTCALAIKKWRVPFGC